jgi:hypothetical protein
VFNPEFAVPIHRDRDCKFWVKKSFMITGILPRKPRLLGGDEEAGIKKIKINYRDAPRFARGASQII